MVDDRTEEQRSTHTWLVIGTDRMLSGWGGATGGASYAVWAHKPKDYGKVLDWVSSRKDQMRVRESADRPGKRYRPNPAYCAHCHIYVVGPDHAALR